MQQPFLHQIGRSMTWQAPTELAEEDEVSAQGQCGTGREMHWSTGRRDKSFVELARQDKRIGEVLYTEIEVRNQLVKIRNLGA